MFSNFKVIYLIVGNNGQGRISYNSIDLAALASGAILFYTLEGGVKMVATVFAVLCGRGGRIEIVPATTLHFQKEAPVLGYLLATEKEISNLALIFNDVIAQYAEFVKTSAQIEGPEKIILLGTSNIRPKTLIDAFTSMETQNPGKIVFHSCLLD